MGLFDRFPWVNTHELNLDWIIQKMKEWGIQATENVQKATQAAQNAAASAETAASDAANAVKDKVALAQEYAREAQLAATSATASAGDCSNSASAAASSAASADESEQQAENAAVSANTSAQLAAQYSNSWPYRNLYKGFLYKTLAKADTRINDNREFLVAPNEQNKTFRVSGNVPGFYLNNEPIEEWHYERMYKISGSPAGGFNFAFTDDLSGAVPQCAPVWVEPVGIYFHKSVGEDNVFLSIPSNVSNCIVTPPTINESGVMVVTVSGNLYPNTQYNADLVIRVIFTNSSEG